MEVELGIGIYGLGVRSAPWAAWGGTNQRRLGLRSKSIDDLFRTLAIPLGKSRLRWKRNSMDSEFDTDRHGYFFQVL